MHIFGFSRSSDADVDKDQAGRLFFLIGLDWPNDDISTPASPTFDGGVGVNPLKDGDGSDISSLGESSKSPPPARFALRSRLPAAMADAIA